MKRFYIDQYKRVKRDKPSIDHILKDKNANKSYQELANELNTTIEEIGKLFWDYMDVFMNPAFYNVDVADIVTEGDEKGWGGGEAKRARLKTFSRLRARLRGGATLKSSR